MDFTGTRLLKQVLDDLDRRHVTFALARVGSHLRANLARSLLPRIGTDRLFPSVDQAVNALGAPDGHRDGHVDMRGRAHPID